MSHRHATAIARIVNKSQRQILLDVNSALESVALWLGDEFKKWCGRKLTISDLYASH